MLHHIKKLFGIKPKVETAPEVPYKVEAPTPMAIEGAGVVDVPKAPAAKKKPAAKKAPAVKKPRATKAK